MQSISSDARFLGVDLKALWQEICHSWQRIHQWPVLSWLTPAVPVILYQADGAQSLWLEGALKSTNAGSVKTNFVAVELPQEHVLRRTLSLPQMGDSDIADAVALEARASSPFVAQDLVWGYRARSGQHDKCSIELAIASRKQVGAYLTTQSGRLPSNASPEVWVRGDQAGPIVLQGYGEMRRNAYAARQRRWGYALLLLAGVLLGGIAVTPTAQLRLRAIDAVLAYDRAVQRTAPLAQQREALMQSVEKLGVLSETLSGRIEPLRVLDKLTKVLPDDTALQSFKLQGGKVTIAGDTANASALLQLLGEQLGLRDVRAPSAAMRVPGAPKESFVIEFVLDPQQFGVIGSTVSAAPPPVASASASAGPAVVAAPASVPAVSPAASVGATPPSTVGVGAPVATVGGRATFGGTMPNPPAATASAATNKNKP